MNDSTPNPPWPHRVLVTTDPFRGESFGFATADEGNLDKRIKQYAPSSGEPVYVMEYALVRIHEVARCTHVDVATEECP